MRTGTSWLQTLAHDYDQVHLWIGIVGNALFVIGSVLFFKRFESWQTFAVWLFVIGSSCMLVGALGEAAKAAYVKRRGRATYPDERSADG